MMTGMGRTLVDEMVKIFSDNHGTRMAAAQAAADAGPDVEQVTTWLQESMSQ